ncbi:MAG: hypothetical protein R3D55_03025 [Chloroflexota bacterium]
MKVNTEQERMLQNKMLDWLNRDLRLTEMLTVYLSDREQHHNYGILCALVPAQQIEKVLSDTSWDLTYLGGKPGAVIYHQADKERVEYLRFGNDDGIEPLIIGREFYGIRENYREISEEFRLFHDLYFDKNTDEYFKIEDSGNMYVVAKVRPEAIQIRVKEIRQFLAIKEMYLSIQFDFREHSLFSLEELGLESGGSDKREPLTYRGLYFGNFSGFSEYQAFSRLLGKRLIPPLPKSKSGLWGFAEDSTKTFVDFIIGVDETGEEIENTSNPDALANYFGANPEAPHYLTPVHFRKQVLDKYYQQPSKYSVEDSILRCGALWSLYIDNHDENKISAWLGDLGRDLPYEEQLYWRSYNVSSDGGVSETYFKRQILGQFVDSNQPDHVFRNNYYNLNQMCTKYLGWQLLLPLEPKDEHNLITLRIPASDEQREFDELVLSLAKIIIDSLNEKQLNKLILKEKKSEIKGSISLLEAIIKSYEPLEGTKHIKFLRNLQSLRSTGTAHRKGTNYQKIAKELEIPDLNLRTVYVRILQQAVEFLEFLASSVQEGYFKVNF